MASKLIPFAGIIETDKFKNSRILRTNLWQKILDTFCVFAGGIHGAWNTPTVKDGEFGDHVGLLDWLLNILSPIFYYPHNLFWEWWVSKKPNDDHLYYLKGAGFFLLNIIINAPKYLVAVILTIASLLIVIPVNIIAYFKSNAMEEEIYELEMSGSYNTQNAVPERQTLRRWMERRTNKDLETLILPTAELLAMFNRAGNDNPHLPAEEDQPEDIEENTLPLGIEKSERRIKLTFFQELDELSVLTHQSRYIKYEVEFPQGEDNSITQRSSAYNAIFRLNLAQITKTLEDSASPEANTILALVN